MRPIEQIEKPGEPIFTNKTTANNYRSWIQGKINSCIKKGNAEYEFFFREVLNAYNHFEPIVNTEIEVEGWKSKSSFEMIKGINELTIIKFERKDKDSAPLEHRTIITREELIGLIESLKTCFERSNSQDNQGTKDYIETKQLIFEYCLKMGIRENDKGKSLFEGDFWGNIYGFRRLHEKFVLMLDGLRELKLIDYRSGKVKLLNKDISIQMIL